jgi:hypothetical protein
VSLADNQDKQAQRAASQAFDEGWWKNYLDQVTKSVLAAEEHLEVPAGTISSIPNDPDFIAAVKTYAVVEPILNDLIASTQKGSYPYEALSLFSIERHENFKAFVTALNIRGPAGKLKLAEGMGLLRDYHIEFIEAVTRVRNRYAHNVKNMHKSLTEILTEEQPNHGRIIAHLTGIQKTLPLPSGLDNDILKWLMYHRLADYLADALQTLRPPPLPEGGILGGLFATENADTASVAARADPEK